MSIKPPAHVSPLVASATSRASARRSKAIGHREVQRGNRKLNQRARKLRAVVQAIEKRSARMHTVTRQAISPSRAAQAYAKNSKLG